MIIHGLYYSYNKFYIFDKCISERMHSCGMSVFTDNSQCPSERAEVNGICGSILDHDLAVAYIIIHVCCLFIKQKC